MRASGDLKKQCRLAQAYRVSCVTSKHEDTSEVGPLVKHCPLMIFTFPHLSQCYIHIQTHAIGVYCDMGGYVRGLQQEMKGCVIVMGVCM